MKARRETERNVDARWISHFFAAAPRRARRRVSTSQACIVPRRRRIAVAGAGCHAADMPSPLFVQIHRRVPLRGDRRLL